MVRPAGVDISARLHGVGRQLSPRRVRPLKSLVVASISNRLRRRRGRRLPSRRVHQQRQRLRGHQR